MNVQKATDLVIRAEQPNDYRDTELMAMRSFWNN